MKTKLFGALLGLLVLCAVELGAFLLMSAASGEAVTWSNLARRRQAQREVEPVETAERPQDWLAHRIATAPPALHPYLGYTADPERHPAARRKANAEALDFGFPLNRHDLFRRPSRRDVVVALFGGSVAASFPVPRRSLQSELEKVRRFAGRRPVVINLAMAGYKQPQQLMTLNYFLALGAHFDVVINLDGFNDVALAPVTHIPNGYAPFYPRGWPLLVGELDQEQRRAVGELTYLRRLRAERAELFSRPAWRYSMTAGLVWMLIDRGLGPRIARAESDLANVESGSGSAYQARGPRREYASEDEMYADLVALWQQSSLLMHGACRVRGIDYFHFLQPNQYLPGSKPLSAEERRQAFQDDHPYRPAVAAAYPRLRAAGEALRHQGVNFVDLTDAFAGVEETLYIDTCCHVNAKGNLLMTKRMVTAFDAAAPASR